MWRLEVLDWAGPTAWRWRLTDDAGAFVADHQVRVDTASWQFEAFTGLHHYLRWNAAPDRRLRHEAEIVQQLGDWIAPLLGPVGPALARHRGAVHVEVPAAAAVLGRLPWELARVNGRTLAEHRVTPVIVAQPHEERDKQAVGERLRMLAVFSLPEGAGALNLRKERVALARLVQRIAKVNGKAIELQVLQYGATRERLEEALLEEPGWDVVHLSGHGLPAGLVLEDAAGRHDLITSADLVALLDRGAEQIKLVTLSACESAAVTAVEHLQQLGLTPAVRDVDDDSAAPDSPGPTLPALAAALVSELDCAVLAMRYPVVDDFAIALAGSFYDLLLGRGQSVARALALSLTQRQVVPAQATAGTPALSIGTPVLFGSRAADLVLAAPPGSPVLDINQKLAEFPDQPPRFVGRVGPLTRAAAVLAPESGRSAIVLHGMAGAGKTACALELAYTHEQTFPFTAWFAAPAEEGDIRPALTAFALATERQLPGLHWVHLVEDAAKLHDFLPRLTETLERNRALIVIDNAESLLTADGQWRDERWAAVIDALIAHRGLSRVVLTSRRLPTGLPPATLVEPVHALSLQESVLLARELPRLRGLIDAAELPAGVTADSGRAAAARVLRAVQGHPKLLELADAAAADPAALMAQLDEADRLWLDRGSGSFPVASSDADYMALLAGWARSAVTQLPPASLLLFRLICGLEDTDREPAVIEQVWPWVWEGADHDAPAPDLTTLLPDLLDAALLAPDTHPDGAIVAWRVHPGIADTTRADTDPTLTTLIEDTLADAWMATLRGARARETQQQGGWLLRAARSAAPYLLRRHRWTDLNTAAEEVLARDLSVAAAAALAPLLDIAATATHHTDHELALARTHARALLLLDPARGTTRLQHLLDLATTRDDHARAANLAGDLVNRYLREGRYELALSLTDQMIDHTRRAGRGPWTQLGDQARRLQIQQLQGHAQTVLDTVEHLQAQMAGLPTEPDRSIDPVDPWSVREVILQTGAFAAFDLELWEQALQLNADSQASLRGREASAHEQAIAAFNDYGPLIRLGRWAEARDLLIGCRAAFDAADDIPGLGVTLGALADVESGMGHLDRAIDMERQALRYKYAVGDPDAIGVSHHNLANYVDRAGTDPASVTAHRAAAAVLGYQTGSGHLPGRLVALGRLLAAHPDHVPVSFVQVCQYVAQVPGVDLAALFDRLPHRAPDGDTALHTVLVASVQQTALPRPTPPPGK